MSKPLSLGGKKLLRLCFRAKNVHKNNIILAALALLVIGSILRILNTQPIFYAHAYEAADTFEEAVNLESKLLTDSAQMFKKDEKGKNKIIFASVQAKNTVKGGNPAADQFIQKIYEIVGDAPIKEMVPFISKRDEKVAAFLVGIAKKESSLGEHSPLKDGQICYNYWGYKGSAGNGSSMGYACFASAEEAVETVGNRIEVLIGKNRNTPAKMVHTWKCGTDCSGDPGAPGWVATVAMYFEKIVS